MSSSADGITGEVIAAYCAALQSRSPLSHTPPRAIAITHLERSFTFTFMPPQGPESGESEYSQRYAA